MQRAAPPAGCSPPPQAQQHPPVPRSQASLAERERQPTARGAVQSKRQQGVRLSVACKQPDSAGCARVAAALRTPGYSKSVQQPQTLNGTKWIASGSHTLPWHAKSAPAPQHISRPVSMTLSTASATLPVHGTPGQKKSAAYEAKTMALPAKQLERRVVSARRRPTRARRQLVPRADSAGGAVRSQLSPGRG